MPAVDVGWLNNEGLSPLHSTLRMIGAHLKFDCVPFHAPFVPLIAEFSAVIGLTGISANGADMIRTSGSSTVFPITKAAIQGYRTTGQGKSVDFDIKETG